jgi:hypothetical protein
MRTEPTAEEINAFRVAVEIEVLETDLRRRGLITTGKLRVLEDVGYDRGGCLKCGEADDHGTQWRGWTYCPGCGNKIKRA